MQKIAGAFPIFVFLIAVTVFPVNTAEAQSGFYAGVFGGYTFSPNASLPYYNYDYYYNYTYSYDINVKETWVLGFKLGYTPPRLGFFSFEFEYSFLNPDVDRTMLPAGAGYTTIEGDIKFNNFMFNTFVKYPQGRIHPYVGLGLGFSSVDVSISTTSAAPYPSYDDTLFAWQILGGIDIDLTNHFSLDLGYRYFATESGSNHYYYYYYDYYNSHIDYKTSMVTFGLKYRF